jgi:oxygen-independent coproporphyrinogen-3 oxidase
MTPDLTPNDPVLKYDGGRVPRYTSYPTAPHFTDAVDESVYRAWLGQVSRGGKLSLYLHVPFCETMCWYCGCHTRATQRYDVVSQYLWGLRREIDAVADALPARLRVAQIHWGGGSPTVLRPSDFKAVMTQLRTCFDVRESTETCIEIDPRTLEEEMVAAVRAAGMTRASIGVQSFDPKVQEAINRIQTPEATRRAVDALRRAGVERINLDLIYGLPHQTPGSCVDTVERALELEPDRLSVFGYAHVPTVRPNQRKIDESALPDGAGRLAQFAAISRALVDRGYRQVGLDHFARPDDPLAAGLDARTVRRNFQGYTTDTAECLIGLGPSAISTLPPGYAQNTASLKDYEDRLYNGRLPIARGRWISRDDRARREVIQDLMTYLRVDLRDVSARHGLDPNYFALEVASLGALEEEGLVAVERGTIRVSDRGRPLVRTVASAFDAYLGESTAVHAQAV